MRTISRFLVFLILCLGPIAAQEFFNIPDPRGVTAVDRNDLTKAKINGLIADGVIVWASKFHWIEVAGYDQVGSGPGKFWMDPQGFAARGPISYVIATGKLIPVAQLPSSNSAGIYSLSVVNFYREWADYFPEGVPELEVITREPEEARRLNLNANGDVAYPLAHGNQFRGDYALRSFNGKIQAFKWAEFIKTNPPKKPTAPGGGTLTWDQVEPQLFMILSSGLPGPEKLTRFRALAGK